MAVTAAIVILCLLVVTQRPRVAHRPITADNESLRHVAAGVDVNTAEWPALAQLPGIGEGLARRIIAYREARREASGIEWAFKTVGDMQSVPGIGPKTVRRIAPFVRFAETESTTAMSGCELKAGQTRPEQGGKASPTFVY